MQHAHDKNSGVESQRDKCKADEGCPSSADYNIDGIRAVCSTRYPKRPRTSAWSPTRTGGEIRLRHV